MTTLETWYNNANQMVLTDRAFYNVTKDLLGAYFQCATTKINQMVFCEYHSFC
jgi:hypothetical protein